MSKFRQHKDSLLSANLALSDENWDLVATVRGLLRIIDYMDVSNGHKPLSASQTLASARRLAA